jgi:hypothetical protein
MKIRRIALLIAAAVALASCGTPQPGLARQTALEKQACAEQGLIPGTDAFQTCFLNLDMTIHDDQLPSS